MRSPRAESITLDLPQDLAVEGGGSNDRSLAVAKVLRAAKTPLVGAIGERNLRPKEASPIAVT